MSEVTTTTNTNNQLTNNYDYSKIFLFGNKYESGSIDNGGGTDVELSAGQVVGRIAATNKLAVMASAAVDGSQFPVGVLAENVIVPAGGSLDIPICVFGEVAEEKIILDGSDTLETVVDLKTYRDRIKSDTMGITLIASDSMTKFDN